MILIEVELRYTFILLLCYALRMDPTFWSWKEKAINESAYSLPGGDEESTRASTGLDA